MSYINKLLNEANLTEQERDAITRSFVKEYMREHPEMLSEVTNDIVQTQIKKNQELKNKNFSLALNFFPVQELLTHGQIEATTMQPFTGLIESNPKMEASFNRLILDKIEHVIIDK